MRVQTKATTLPCSKINLRATRLPPFIVFGSFSDRFDSEEEQTTGDLRQQRSSDGQPNEPVPNPFRTVYLDRVHLLWTPRFASQRTQR